MEHEGGTPSGWIGFLDADGALGEVESVGPEAGGGVDGLHDGFDGVEVLGDLVFGDDERRGDFEDHEVVAAHLGEDVVVLEETHDEHLAEHAGVNGAEGLEGDAEAEGGGRLHDDAVEETEPRTSENISKRLRRWVSWARSSAPRCSARAGEVFGFEDVEGGEAGAHGESVLAEGGGVDDGFFEGAVDGLVDVVAHENGGDGDEASAEGFGEDDHVGLDVVAMAGDEGAGAADAGLDFVEDEEGAVFFAEALDGGEVAGGGGDDAGFALEGFEDDGGDFVGWRVASRAAMSPKGIS